MKNLIEWVITFSIFVILGMLLTYIDSKGFPITNTIVMMILGWNAGNFKKWLFNN